MDDRQENAVSFEDVSEAAIASFERDGVVCLRKMLSADWIDTSRRGIERNIEQPGQFFRDQTPEGSPARYVFDFWVWPQVPEFKKLIFGSPAAEIAGRLMRSRTSTLIMDNWFMKEAGATNGAPWHHDEPYFDFDGRGCVVWFPMEPTSAEEGLTFVRGSHAWGKLFKPSNFREHEPFEGAYAGYHDMPDIDAHKDDYELIRWDVDVGDCLVFDLRAVHGATAGSVPFDRTIRRMSLRFGADDMRFRPRGEWTREITDHLIGLGQKEGAALDCSLTPTVWHA
jgi:ectoine hydroxylase-related dioxygenase (phytanoyl-CoA dioxygenase family)